MIKVNFEAEKYYTSMTDKWQEVTGHLVTVDEFMFVIFLHGGNKINVFEQTSGARLFDKEISDSLLLIVGVTQESTVDFFEKAIGPEIQKIIENVGHEKMQAEIEKMRKRAFEYSGPHPDPKEIKEWMNKNCR